MERRLAAILSADVVGYSRLMERAEADTFERLRAHRKELFEPEIGSHNGHIFKLMGDGLLAEFASAVDAVECATAIQQGMTTRNAGLAQEERIECRIGVNLGDVIIEKDAGGVADFHGDGVIIAHRLQALGSAGDVLVSGIVYDQLKNKVAAGFESLGSKAVKNIAEPVRVYRVLMDPDLAGTTIDAAAKTRRSWRWPALAGGLLLLAAAAGAGAWLRPWEPKIAVASVERMALPLPDTPSIVVLPLANLSNDPGQDYFSDGITEDLITELSKIPGLFVIARNTSFSYKGKVVRIAQVAEDLGVRYILEGSVQRAGDQVRINAQLIDALNGGHVWADRIDGTLANVFSLQDQVTSTVADALALRVTASQQVPGARQETNDPLAYEAFLRGWEHYRKTTPEDFAKAIPFFEEATRLDPEYSRAYAALAMVYVRSYARGWAGQLGLVGREARRKALQNIDKARKRPSSLAYQAAGYIQLDNLSSGEAIKQFKEAIVLDPSDSWSYAFAAFALATAGRAAEAIPYIDTAMRLDPRPPALFLYYLGVAQFNMENFAKAAESLQRATLANPDDEFSFLALAATYGHLGQTEKGKAAIARYNALEVRMGGVPATVIAQGDLYFLDNDALNYQSRDYQRLVTGLRLAGVPERLSSGEFADQNRLGPHEARTLLFGHRIHGRSGNGVDERAASFSADGIVSMSGDWITSPTPLTDGLAGFRDENLCVAFGPQSYCGPVMRNPGGTPEKENEYIWAVSSAYTFSPVR